MGVAEETVPGQRTVVAVGTVATGLVIGAVEAVFAVSFATLAFAGYLEFYFLADGVGLYLGAAGLTLGLMAWRAGRRGVVGALQPIAAAFVAVVATSAVIHAGGSPRNIFLTAVAATLLTTVLSGVVFLWLGARRRGDLIRFVPYPVVGGFLAGAGWLLVKGGIYAAAGLSPSSTPLGDLVGADALERWLPALAFGAVAMIAVRVVKRPLTLPVVIAIGLVAFVLGMVLTGSSIDEAREGGWLLGSFGSAPLWKTWTLSTATGTDWLGVLGAAPAIVTAVFVTTITILFTISETEAVLDRGLDTNRELRDAGIVNVVSGALGGIPAYHVPSFTAIAKGTNVDARVAGLVGAVVPIAAVVFGGSVVGLLPRVIVGGVLAFLGLSLIVEWVWGKRRLLPRLEYGVVWSILLAFVVWGLLPGVVIGLVLAVVLFAISYGRVELVREVAFGESYRSSVDRPVGERADLRALSEQVQILRVSGFVFFGSTNRLLERIRHRVKEAPPRFLVIDLRRVTGVDASAVVSFVKMTGLAESAGFEIVFTAASDGVRKQLARGGVVEAEGVVSFEPDLDRGLQRCEDALLSAPGLVDAVAEHPAGGGPAGLPPGLSVQLERVGLEAGDILLHQDDPPGDIFVLESGRLGVEAKTPEGARMRLRTLRPGVVVGEVTLYTDVARTADVVAEQPSVVLRISRDAIERLEAEQPELAAQLHRWLATTLAERLTDSLRSFDMLLD